MSVRLGLLAMRHSLAQAPPFSYSWTARVEGSGMQDMDGGLVIIPLSWHSQHLRY